MSLRDLLSSDPTPKPRPFGVAEHAPNRLWGFIPMAFVYSGSEVVHASIGLTPGHAVRRADRWRIDCIMLGTEAGPLPLDENDDRKPMNTIDRPNPVTNQTYTEKELAAAFEIVKDLSDRRGLRHVWEEIDSDVRAEIIETWAQIIHDNK